MVLSRSVAVTSESVIIQKVVDDVLCNFLDQELLPYHYLSCSCCWGDCLQNSLISVVSNWIGMKFGTIVLQVNTHWLTESDF